MPAWLVHCTERRWAVYAVLAWAGLNFLSSLVAVFIELDATKVLPLKTIILTIAFASVAGQAGRVASFQRSFARRRWQPDAHLDVAAALRRRDFPALVALLREGDEDQKRTVITGLRDLGAAATPAVPALVEVVKERLPFRPEQTGFCQVCQVPLTAWNHSLFGLPGKHPGVCVKCEARSRMLAEAPESVDPTPAEMAAGALGRIGPLAKPAVPALKAACESKDATLSRAAMGVVAVDRSGDVRRSRDRRRGRPPRRGPVAVSDGAR